MNLTHGSLCTGYGGLDMAVRQVFGSDLAWWADIDPGSISLMRQRHPAQPNLGDISTIADWHDVPPVDLLTAGYPCQPFSDAGRRLGIQDPRHIWPHIAAAVGVLRPSVVVLENVAAHVRRGFDNVAADLAALGYDTAWTVVRAADIGAPHKRERMFVVAADTRASGWTLGSGPDTGATPEPAHRESVGGCRDAAADAGRTPRGRTAGNAVSSISGTPVQQRQAEPGRRHRPTADPGRAGLQVGSVERDGPECSAAERGSGNAATTDPQGDGRAQRQPEPAGPERASGFAGCGVPDRGIDYGPYEPAVQMWECIIGRPAPAPTIPGRRVSRVLNPVFVEWMMGLNEGYVTHCPDLTRTQMLRLLGNGVVPQQAVYALHHLITVLVETEISSEHDGEAAEVRQ